MSIYTHTIHGKFTYLSQLALFQNLESYLFAGLEDIGKIGREEDLKDRTDREGILNDFPIVIANNAEFSVGILQVFIPFDDGLRNRKDPHITPFIQEQPGGWRKNPDPACPGGCNGLFSRYWYRDNSLGFR